MNNMHGAEHDKIWKSIEELRITSQNTLNAAAEQHLSIEAGRDRVNLLTLSVESLVEAVRNDVNESKALRTRLDQKETDTQRRHDELMTAHQDLMAELRLAKADNRDLYAVIRALIDRLPPPKAA
jgi:hypothetical protein